MKLSILILTHNRPELFKRAINSVLDNLPPYGIEILVNNDTEDIIEIYDERTTIKYFYHKDKSLASLYKVLFDEASGQFIYYLEDDDYLTSKFFDTANLDYDINFMEYIRSPEFIQTHIQQFGIPRACKFARKNPAPTLREFLDINTLIDFQLSQILFRKSKLGDFYKLITDPNYIKNDENLLHSLDLDSTLYYNSNRCWVQTSDGQDNLTLYGNSI